MDVMCERIDLCAAPYIALESIQAFLNVRFSKQQNIFTKSFKTATDQFKKPESTIGIIT